MAYSFIQSLLLFTFLSQVSLSSTQTPNSPTSILLPVTKHAPTNQYLTQIHLGTPPRPVSLVVDIGSPFLWTDCSSGPPSPTKSPIQCPSIQCLTANATPCGAPQPAAHVTSSPALRCSLSPENAITGESGSGQLVEDIISLQFPSGSNANPITSVHRFLFSCASPLLLNGLAAGARGVMGLGRSRISLPFQLAPKLPFSRKFSVCMSRKKGMIFSGQVSLPHLAEISKSLVYTPILGSGSDYYINVNSIKINGKKLASGFSSPAKFSTMVQYTTMESRIYERFIRGFDLAADSMNLTRASAVAPFAVCYRKEGGGWAAVPVVDLVLQSEMVKWRIYGHNLMVEVGDDVMCLGFLDGGLDLGTQIVIGGYQLEDNLVEFDLDSSMLGFSSSLLRRETSCSKLSLYSLPKGHESS
ncbi:hypothetical protein Ancab_030430 [Ancistrocladus abbreviatus]